MASNLRACAHHLPDACDRISQAAGHMNLIVEPRRDVPPCEVWPADCDTVAVWWVHLAPYDLERAAERIANIDALGKLNHADRVNIARAVLLA